MNNLMRLYLHTYRVSFLSLILVVVLISFVIFISNSPKTSEESANNLENKNGQIDHFKDKSYHNKFPIGSNVSTDPVKHFKFYALHKTASVKTRHELIRFCMEYKLNCITYQFCSDDMTEMVMCFQKNTIPTKEGWFIDPGIFTFDRLKNCCPKMKQNKTMFHGLVDHFSTRSEANVHFLNNSFPANSFQFTIIREPSEQFVSYHKMYYNNYKYNHRDNTSDILPLAKMIELFHNHTTLNTRLSAFNLQLFQLITNSQSKELGWAGHQLDESHSNVLKLIGRMDFVGLTAHLCESWQLLRERLRWPKHYFRPKLWSDHHSRLILSQLHPNHHKMLIKVQFADYELHETAKKIFASYF